MEQIYANQNLIMSISLNGIHEIFNSIAYIDSSVRIHQFNGETSFNWLSLALKKRQHISLSFDDWSFFNLERKKKKKLKRSLCLKQT